jgi:DNA-binding SARP family transcriptional activator
MLWLDPQLVEVDSSQLMVEMRDAVVDLPDVDLVAIARRYSGHFSPEFEYEEWAIAWRSRVHATFLRFVAAAIETAARRGEYQAGVEVAEHALRADPTAADIERKLIWLYWHIGARSAAVAQYEHMVAAHAADGLDAPELAELTSAARPPP